MSSSAQSEVDLCKRKTAFMNSFDQIADFPSAFSNSDAHLNAVQSLVLSYWLGLMRQGRIPHRSDIDPNGIEPALDHIFVAERINTGHLKLRQVGRHLIDLFECDVRGLSLCDFFAPSDHQTMSLLLETALQHPARLTLSLTAHSGIGQSPLSSRMMLLPMRSDLGDLSRLLGCLISFGGTGSVPRQFHLTDVELCTADLRGDRLPLPTIGNTLPDVESIMRPSKKGARHLHLVHSS